jgi:hypothetical protein
VTDETRARFLAAIAAQIPIERIAEVHLFPAIRQGGMESGVAVIAVERAAEATDEVAEEPTLSDASDAADERDREATVEDGDAVVEESDVESAPPRPARRYTVFSARYRHTLKGPERGKWEVGVTEEADAPLRTVDAVVRGVQRRSGDADEMVRLSGDEVRALLPVTAAT